MTPPFTPNTFRCVSPPPPDPTALYRWPMGRITWRQSVVLKAIPGGLVATAYRRAWYRWSLVCGIEPDEVSGKLACHCESRSVTPDPDPDGRFDPARTLVLTQLPAHATKESRLVQVVNDHPAWDYALLNAVLRHEIGHFLGLVHSPHPDDVMYPVYNLALNDLSPGDIAQAQLRYGPSRVRHHEA